MLSLPYNFVAANYIATGDPSFGGRRPKEPTAQYGFTQGNFKLIASATVH
jgi:hypothetical protein